MSCPPAPNFPGNSKIGFDEVKVQETVGMNDSSCQARGVLWPRFYEDWDRSVSTSMLPSLNREPGPRTNKN